MDWHHPDGARCATDEAARKRFVEYIHTQIRELLTNYGKIDVLWYDVSWPLDAAGWESERDEQNGLRASAGHHRQQSQQTHRRFFHSEQQITADKEGRAWESCMTLNDSWDISGLMMTGKARVVSFKNLILARVTPELFVEHRALALTAASRRIRPRIDGSRPMDAPQR